MRRLLFLAVLVALAGSGAGCVPVAAWSQTGLPNVYCSNPNRRMADLINNPEDLPQVEDEWERCWFTDQPSHLTPERVHGGVQ